jgi:hypothetical protein
MANGDGASAKVWLGHLDDGVGRYDVAILADDDDLEGGVDAGQRSQRLERSDEVEGRESGVQDERDLLRGGGAHGSSSRSDEVRSQRRAPCAVL